MGKIKEGRRRRRGREVEEEMKMDDKRNKVMMKRSQRII